MSGCHLFFGNFPTCTVLPRHWSPCHRSHNPFLWHSLLNLHCAHLLCSPPSFRDFLWSLLDRGWSPDKTSELMITAQATLTSIYLRHNWTFSCTSVRSANSCYILSSGKVFYVKGSHLPFSFAGQTSCVHLGLLRTAKPRRQLLCCAWVKAGLVDTNLDTNPQAHSMCCLFFLALISLYWLIFTLWVLGVNYEIQTMTAPGNRHNRNMREPSSP